MPETKLVVEHREHLWNLLIQATQIEHLIMCQYLYASFSLKTGPDEGLTPEQADAVARWHKLLTGIAVEEMLHLALVANVSTAIGAAPSLGRPNFPRPSEYLPSGVQFALLPFGDAALTHFLYLERPEGMERVDAEEFVPAAPPPDPVTADEIMPRSQNFLTVGHLYRGIEDGLTHLASARAAVEEIIEQGEGARGNWQPAHYGRFLGIWEEYRRLSEQDPGFRPARPVIPAFTQQPVDNAEPQPLLTDPATRRIAELFDLGYEVVVHTLTRFFTHNDETGEQLGILVDAAFGLMAGVLRPLATALTRLPAGPEHPGRTAGPTFEMYYQMGNVVPWREAAWALLAERTAVLASRCAEEAGREGAPEAVATAARTAAGISAQFTAQVPDRLRPVG